MAEDAEELYVKDLRETLRGARRRYPKLVTTLAVGEEGDQPTTTAVGEEGDADSVLRPQQQATAGPCHRPPVRHRARRRTRPDQAGGEEARETHSSRALVDDFHDSFAT